MRKLIENFSKLLSSGLIYLSAFAHVVTGLLLKNSFRFILQGYYKVAPIVLQLILRRNAKISH